MLSPKPTEKPRRQEEPRRRWGHAQPSCWNEGRGAGSCPVRAARASTPLCSQSTSSRVSRRRGAHRRRAVRRLRWAPSAPGGGSSLHTARASPAACTLRAPHLHLRDPPRPAPHRPRRALRTRDTACQAGAARGLGRLRLTDLSRLRRRTRGASRPWHLPRPPPRCVPSTAFLQRVASSFSPLDRKPSRQPCPGPPCSLPPREDPLM